MAGNELAHPHGDRGRAAGHQEDGPVTAKQQAEGTAGEPHHGHHQPGVIVERRDGLEALTYLARADKRLFRHDADALDFAHHLHVDAVLPHPAGGGDATALVEAGEDDGAGRDGHLDALQPERHAQADRGLLDDAALRPKLGQHLARLDDDPGDLRLLLSRQHPSWCDASHDPFES